MAAVISLYLDENLSPTVTQQLVQQGIDAVCVRDLDLLGDTDANHLSRATEMGRALVTSDADFLRMAAGGVSHAGIVYGRQGQFSIGDWVRSLALICAVYTPEDMLDHVEYL